MIRRIICDSSSDLCGADLTGLISVPLKIITSEKEYSDDENLNSEAMLSELEKYKGKTRSSCPNPNEYLAAFEGADEVFCLTITSALSGSFNSAQTAGKIFEEQGGKALIIDSLTTGPESALILEKLKAMLDKERTFEDIKAEIFEYKKKTKLSFALASLSNLAKNGRVSQITAKLCGVLGIRIIGKASDAGTLEVVSKARGEKNALLALFESMKKLGYKGGKVRIHHAKNENAAAMLKDLILKAFEKAKITVAKTRGLCSFYAETGGLLVGYET